LLFHLYHTHLRSCTPPNTLFQTYTHAHTHTHTHTHMHAHTHTPARESVLIKGVYYIEAVGKSMLLLLLPPLPHFAQGMHSRAAVSSETLLPLSLSLSLPLSLSPSFSLLYSLP